MVSSVRCREGEMLSYPLVKKQTGLTKPSFITVTVMLLLLTGRLRERYWLQKRFFKICNFMCMYLCMTMACEYQRHLILPELKLHTVVNCSLWVLGIELGSSAGAVCASEH